MTTILTILISIAVLIATYVVYYFLYRNYANERLEGKCKQKRLPHPTMAILYVALFLSIALNAIFGVELGQANEKIAALQVEKYMLNQELYITEIDAESPYAYYRDMITSSDSYGYKVTHEISDGFHFYFGCSEYKGVNTSTFYPGYICYIKYDGVLDKNIDMITEYVYDERNWNSEVGPFYGDLMLLSGNLQDLPQEIRITIKEAGPELEGGDIIARASFVLYSIDE